MKPVATNPSATDRTVPERKWVERIGLRENGSPVEVGLDAECGQALMQSGFVDARFVPGTGRWEVRALNKVGAIQVTTPRSALAVEVHVRPKIDVRRVVALLEWSPAGVVPRDDRVTLDRDSDLLTAMVEAFLRVTESAMRQGLVQGYRRVEESLAVIRGRIREADQMKRRFALPVPVEVSYDDFTVDTPENRLLRLATHRAGRIPGLGAHARRRIGSLAVRFGDAALVTHPALLEPWHETRLNARFHHALRLAQLIVDGTSFELRSGDVTVTGFVVNMAKVFEDVVCTFLGRALTGAAGRCRTRDTWFLDTGQEVRMRPDLVWYGDDGRPLGVVDAKYKAEKPAGFPDADLYQMLAYCTALGLAEGHLVYARGEERARAIRVAGSGVTLHAHTVDLDVPPQRLVEQLDALAQRCVTLSRGGVSQARQREVPR